MAATLVAALLRLFHLGAQSLWVDEAFTWFNADIGRPYTLASLLENVHGPLYSLLVHVWGGLAGDAEWALRAPAMLAGVAAVPALAWLSGRWLGRETETPAAWLAAGSPFLVWYSQEARNYMVLVLAACLAGGLLLGPARRAGTRALAYLPAAWLGLLANFTFALLAPLHLAWWLRGDGSRATPAPHGASRSWPRRLVWPAALGLALAVLVLPWVPQASRIWDWRRLEPAHASSPAAEPPLRGATTFHAAAIPFAVHAFAVGYTLGPSLRELKSDTSASTLARHAPELVWSTLLFGFLGLAGLGALRRRGRLLEALLWLAVPAAVISFFALRNFKVFHPRYVAASAPGFLLVLAAGLTDLPTRWRRVAVVALGLTWAVSLGQHYFDPHYAKEDYRSAMALVAARGAPDEKVLAVGAEEPIYYYYRGPLPLDRLWLGFVARPERLRRELDGKLEGASGTWIVLSRPEDLDPADVFAHTLAERHADAESFRFNGVRVWHVRPRGAAGAATP